MRLFTESSIRTRILISLLGITTVAVIITAGLGVNALVLAGNNAQESSRVTLRQQAEEFLITLTSQNAAQNNQEFEHIVDSVKNVATFASNLFNNAGVFSNSTYWRVEDNMSFGEGGQYINTPTDVSTIWVPSNVDVDDAFNRKLELVSHLDFIFEPVLASNPNTVAIYIIGQEEYTRLYPNIDLPGILPADFRATEDIFYLTGAPENNPDGAVVWTPIYDDPAQQGLLVSAVAPIYSNDGFQGVIGLDVSLTSLTQSIESNQTVAGGYSFLIDNNGQAIAIPAQGITDIFGDSSTGDNVGADLASSDVRSGFTPIVASMRGGETGFQSVQVEGEELFIAYAPLSSTGWSLATVVRAENMLQVAGTLQAELQSTTERLIFQQVIPFGIAILIAGTILGMWFTNRLIVPIKQLADAARRVGAGDLNTPIPVAGNDEIGVLAETLKNTTEQLRHLIGNLESRVEERTQELQTVAEVTSNITKNLDSEVVLSSVTTLTKDTFNLYNVSIFTYDPETDDLSMAYASNQDVTRIDKVFKRADEGIVSNCARTRKSITVNDVTNSDIYIPHPELPHTKSEIALPLIFGEKLLGVLDLQSDEIGRFQHEHVSVFETLADQIAVAINNAQLFGEAQDARRAAELSDRVKSSFLASMSHELRTPLNAIINFSKFLSKQIPGPLNEEQQELIVNIGDSGQHLLQLINDVLDMSKIESGSLKLYRTEDVNLAEVMQTAIRYTEPILADKPVAVHQNLPENLPALYADKKRLTQIFLNILSNACKFTDEGRITINGEIQGDTLLVTIQDTGAGIADTEADHVFTAFKQTDSGLRSSGGTGLGMPITKKLVEAHEGNIWFESQVNRGTTFFIELPLSVMEKIENA